MILLFAFSILLYRLHFDVFFELLLLNLEICFTSYLRFELLDLILVIQIYHLNLACLVPTPIAPLGDIQFSSGQANFLLLNDGVVLYLIGLHMGDGKVFLLHQV